MALTKHQLFDYAYQPDPEEDVVQPVTSGPVFADRCKTFLKAKFPDISSESVDLYVIKFVKNVRYRWNNSGKKKQSFLNKTANKKFLADLIEIEVLSSTSDNSTANTSSASTTSGNSVASTSTDSGLPSTPIAADQPSPSVKWLRPKNVACSHAAVGQGEVSEPHEVASLSHAHIVTQIV